MYSEDSKVILDRMKSKITTGINVEEGSFANDVLVPSADEFKKSSSNLDTTLENGFGVTAEGIYLDYKCAEVGITRSDGETDDALRERYLNTRQKPATSGNTSSYITWAQEVAGIGKAKAYPRWNGVNSLKLVLLTTDKASVSQSKIDEVFAYIEDRRPIGCDVTVVSATAISIDIKLNITLKTDGVLQDAIDQINTALGDYFKSIAFTETIIRYTKIVEAILSAEDVLDFENLTINNKTSNIELNDDEFPVVGAVQFL